MKISETTLGPPAIRHLEHGGYEVHQEVAPLGGGWPRADICGVLSLPSGKRITHVIELKASFTADLVDQALHWVGYSNYTTICTPKRVKGSPSRALRRLCQHEGIGVMSLSGLDYGNPYVHDYVPPRLQRTALTSYLLKALHAETRAGVARAGSQDRFSTPFSRTFDATVEFIKRSPHPVTMREVVTGISHHYSSDQCARSSLVKWLTTGRLGAKHGIKAIAGPTWRFTIETKAAA